MELAALQSRRSKLDSVGFILGEHLYEIQLLRIFLFSLKIKCFLV